MITKTVFSLCTLCFLSTAASAAEPVCHRCEEIREYNAKYHENFEYYDDYTKKEGKEVAVKSDPVPKKKDTVQSIQSSTQTSPSKK